MAGVRVLSSPTLPNLNQSMDDLLNELTNGSVFPASEQSKDFPPALFGDGNYTSSGSSEFPPPPFSPTDNIPVELGAGDPTFDQFLNTTHDDDECLSTFDPTLPPKWSFNEDGTTDDGVGVPRKPGPSPTSSGAFDMGDLANSLAKLEKHVKGSFFCLRAKSDRIDPNTGELLSRQTGQQVSAVTTLDPITTKRLRTIAAQSYYGTTLSPKIDRPLNGAVPPSLINPSFFPTNLPPQPSFQSNSFIPTPSNSSSGSTNLLMPPAAAINQRHAGQELVVPSSWMVGGTGNTGNTGNGFFPERYDAYAAQGSKRAR